VSAELLSVPVEPVSLCRCLCVGAVAAGLGQPDTAASGTARERARGIRLHSEDVEAQSDGGYRCS